MGRKTSREIVSELSNEAVQRIIDLFTIDNYRAQDIVTELEIDLQHVMAVINTNKLKKTKEQRAECRKRTNLEKYGVVNPFQSEEVKDKIKDTIKNRYGVSHVSQSDEIKAKKRATSMEHYGVDNPNKSEEVKRKKSETYRERYGVSSHLQSEIIKARIIQTNLEKYGTKHPMQSDEVKQKIHNTFIEKYGRDRYTQVSIPEESIKILHNKDLLTSYILNLPSEERTIRNLSSKLGYSTTAIGSVCEQYGIDNLIYRPKIGRSSYEIEIQKFLEDSGISNLVHNKRIISPYEIDLYSDEYKVGIEFNGDYWHSTEKLESNYHQMKSLLAKEKGIFIYHIFEHEWNNEITSKIIKSQLLNLFSKNITRVYARKCEIRNVSTTECRRFLIENHIQGYRVSKYRYGLYYNDELVSLMTFGKDKFIDKSDNWQLLRFCSKLGYSVVGGASKLFKHFIDEVNPDKVISYCDIAKGRGTTYEKLGFRIESISSCNYKWTNRVDTKTRYQCQKRFIRESEDDPRTEHQIMTDRGYYQVFDCGSYKFVWTK